MFGLEGDDDGDKDEGPDAEGKVDGEQEGDNEADRRYHWLRQIDEVAHTKRISWDEVWRMGVIEFFNIVDYIKEKNRRETDAMKQWQMKYRKH